MKNKLSKILAICIILTMLIPANVFAVKESDENKEKMKDTISIVFSHDMHSHLEKFPKISTVIKETKELNDSTFVLDAGDFSMGTPFQTIFKSDASELRMMGKIGYDVTTLGNHEFDYRSKGLRKMLESAVKYAQEEAIALAEKDLKYVWNPEIHRFEKEKVDVKSLDLELPKLVASNIDWDSTLTDSSLKHDGEALKRAFKKYKAKVEENSYYVLKRGDARIAVFGLMGKESDSYAPESGTKFLDTIETAKKTVDAIKKNEKNIDLIVCLSHSGTYADSPENSEDEILAKEVKDIDLIISGHTHSFLEEPIIVGDTVIASTGQYNSKIGTITFKKDKKEYELDDYELVKLSSDIEDDEDTQGLIDEYKQLVDEKYFEKYGFTWDEVIAKNNISFTDIDEFGLTQGEDTLGNLISDSYIYGVDKAEGKDYEKVDVVIVPAGVIRASFDKGDVTTEDVFNALSLGTGKDGKAGYPLVGVYLTGKEIKLAAEIDISVSELMQPARLYMSGVKYEYNPNRMFLNRAYNIVSDEGNGNTSEFDNKKLYRVVGDLYTAQMLGKVASLSKGFLSVEPKDKDGNVIKNFEDHIIYDKNGNELKEWYALATYIDSFKNNKFPSKYKEPEGRKVLVDSKNIINIMKKPNKFMIMVVTVVVLVIAIFALIISIIIRVARGKRYGRGTVKKKDRIFSR